MGAVKDLIIVGFSGFGKEVYWLATRLGIKVSGFLDDNADIHGEKFGDAQVLGCIDDWVKYSNSHFVIAIGSPRVRRKIFNKMKGNGNPEFATLIDPDAILNSEYVKVGKGSIVCAGTVCTVDVEIGQHVIINLNCTVGHDTIVDDFVTIAPMVAVSGNVHLFPLVEVGTGSCIRQGLNLESGSMLGMGSVLTKNIKENVVFFGNPAKAFKTIPPDDLP